jgi:hypothetical protein
MTDTATVTPLRPAKADPTNAERQRRYRAKRKASSRRPAVTAAVTPLVTLPSVTLPPTVTAPTMSRTDVTAFLGCACRRRGVVLYPGHGGSFSRRAAVGSGDGVRDGGREVGYRRMVGAALARHRKGMAGSLGCPSGRACSHQCRGRVRAIGRRSRPGARRGTIRRRNPGRGASGTD